jgi:hypothetical protein
MQFFVIFVCVFLIQHCSSQTRKLFDHDSPLGNRLGYADTDESRPAAMRARTMEARLTRRNSNGRRILAVHGENNSVTLEVNSDGDENGFNAQENEDEYEDEEKREIAMGTARRRRLADTTYPSIVSSLSLSNEVKLFYDPPDRSFSPCALGLFVRSNKESAKVYYEFEDVLSQVVADPTLGSAFATWETPYIHLNTPFGATRNRSVTIVAVWFDYQAQSLVRSEPYALRYIVEADARPLAFGFLVPGVESSGFFIKFTIEMKAAARAQAAGGQEFADFNTELAVGTYDGQIVPLDLPSLDPDLRGFEGGFTVNCSSRSRHFGILVPFHSGSKFVGKVVKVDLQNMDDTAACLANYRYETKVNGNIVITGPGTRENACVHILDLPSLHKDARGFRRGFSQMPYAYLSPGEFNIPVRCNVCNFGLDTTKVLDLGLVEQRYGGYSGGFVDYHWSCFCPFRSYSGPFGGVRSLEIVDQGHLRPYFHAEVLCIHSDGWNGVVPLKDAIRSFDLGNVDVDLRGYSEALRVGRFAYLAPLAVQTHVYNGKLVRIYLGAESIGDTLDYLAATGGKVRDIVDILDLKILDKKMAGFSGLFSSGKFLFLVPFRNEVELFNGQRGHGNVVRIDMNNFDLGGIRVLDLSTTTRSQIPSFADEDLRGFSGGFASGKYGIVVPFFNAVFSGKVGRFVAITDDLEGNVQELNMMVDRVNPGAFKGYRGGFVSLWKGVYDL